MFDFDYIRLHKTIRKHLINDINPMTILLKEQDVFYQKKENRVNFALPADYREGKEIDCVVKTILNKIATDRDLEILRKREDRKKEGCSI